MMDTQAFLAQLTQWLSRHPLKTPVQEPEAAYTRQVMDRILRAPQVVVKPAWAWWRRPSVALAFGGVCAAVAVGLIWWSPPPAPEIAQAPARVDEPPAQDRLAVPREPVLASTPEEPPAHTPMASPSEPSAPIQLAALPQETAQLPAPSLTEEERLVQTLVVLGELGEDLPALSDDHLTSEEWLEELQWCDEQDLASSS